jgi:RNA polymerase sigma-70 factor (ECF subfamily)
MTSVSGHDLGLDAVLVDVVAGAQRDWPGLRVPADAFAAYVAERIPADTSPLEAIGQLHLSDLYLACGCARGDAKALAAFDAHCLGQLDRLLAGMGVDADVSAEVKQDIRSRVLVGDGRAPEILDFTGRGDLRSWVRVMAIRRALRRMGRARRDVSVEDDELMQRLVAPGNPELDYAKGIYRREFKQAFEAALRELPDRERTVLRQHYVDELTIDQLGRLYRVHRSTAARMLVRARDLVLEAIRARMMQDLDVPSQDLDSIMRMIRSQIDISLRVLQRGRP